MRLRGDAPSLRLCEDRLEWKEKGGDVHGWGGRGQASDLWEKVTLTQCAQLTLQVKNNQCKGLAGQGRWCEKALSSHYLPISPLEGRNVPKD